MGDSGAAKPVRSVSRARMTTEGWCSAVNAWMGYCRAKKGIYTTYTPIGTALNSVNCGVPINNGPQHFVAKAAFNSLDYWVRSGGTPAAAHRLEATSTTPATLLRDADGIVLGGIRTPLVDVPVDAHSGIAGPSPSTGCILAGSSPPLSEARLAQLYASRADYVQRYADATDAAIKAGFVLAADREALIARSDPSRIPD